jgi:hypothetical protein
VLKGRGGELDGSVLGDHGVRRELRDVDRYYRVWDERYVSGVRIAKLMSWVRRCSPADVILDLGA